MEDDIDSKILRTLLENGSMTCRAIDKATKLNDRMVRRRLKLLQEKGLVDQTRKGRSDCNSLTQRGEHLFIDNTIGKIEKDLATVSRIDKKISPGQWKALARLHMRIGLVLRARKRLESEKQEALESVVKEPEVTIREIGKRDVVFQTPKEG